MIQRIQSIYLFFASVAMVIMLIFPIAIMVGTGEADYVYLFYGIVSAEGELLLSAVPLAVLLSAIPLISLVSIFLYRHRILQLRLCSFNILLMLGGIVLIWYYGYHAGNSLSADALYSVPAIMPVLAAILSYLAFRGIRKDELLIQSVERIR